MLILRLLFLAPIIFFQEVAISSEFVDDMHIKDKPNHLVVEFGDVDKHQDGNFSILPSELLIPIFSFMRTTYPWDELKAVYRLTHVCKKWFLAIMNFHNFESVFNIPPLHANAMANNIVGIMSLKLLKKYQLFEKDKRGFYPAHYAIATKSYDAMKILDIAQALKSEDASIYRSLKNVMSSDDQECQKIFYASHEKKYNKEELQLFFENLSMNELMEKIWQLENKLTVARILPGSRDVKEINTDEENHLALVWYAFLTNRENNFLYHFKHNIVVHPYVAKSVEKLSGLNPNTYGWDGVPLLHYASKSPLFEFIVKRLLGFNDILVNLPTINNEKRSALHYAITANNVNIVAYLLAKGADPAGKDSLGDTAWHNAAFFGSVEILVLLKSQGGNLDTLNNQGYSPLAYALNAKRVDCAQFLIDNKASLSWRSLKRKNLLHEAAKNGLLNSCPSLLNQLADEINATDNDGLRPMHEASSYGQTSSVALLIGKGADVNVGDRYQETPLHKAATIGHLDIVKNLIKAQADVYALTVYQKTAMQLAQENGRNHVVSYLKDVYCSGGLQKSSN